MCRMWIKQAQINSFGQFQQINFDFENDFQVVYGLNEAGKTTLHQFISGVLFGFPTARGSKKKTFENLVGGTYGGNLTINVHNQDYRITRIGRTESKLTLTDLDSEKEYDNPEKKLQEILVPLTSELFNAIYSFDQEALLAIFNLRPDSFNDHLRSIATPGAEEWMQVATDLDKTAALQMGRTKTAKRPINQALSHLNQLEQQYQQRLTQSPNLLELEQELNQRRQNLNALQEQQKMQQKRAANQSDLAAYRPALQQLQQLDDQLSNRQQMMEPELSRKITALNFQIHTDGHSETPSITKSQLDQADRNLELLEHISSKKQQLEKNLQDDEQQLQMLRSKWQVDNLPKPLSTEQLSAFQASQSISNEPFLKPMMLGGIIFVILGILLLLLKQISGASIFIIVGLGLIVWQYGHVQSVSVPNFDLVEIDSEYQHWKPEMVDLVQGDAREQMILKDNIATDQGKLQDIQGQIIPLDQALACLGQDDNHNQRRLKLSELKLKQQHFDQEQSKRLKQQATMQSLLKKLGLQSWSEFEQRQIEDQQTKELLEKQRLLNEQLKDIDRQSLEGLPDDDQRIRDQQKMLHEINQQQASLTQLEYQWGQIKKDDSLEYLSQQLADERTRVFEDLQQYFVDKVLSQWVQSILNQTIGERLPQLMKQASEYLQSLTEGRYIELKYTKTLIRAKNAKGELFNLIDLSKGTAEQIYVALRLAFIQQMDSTAKFPILIDDAFVDFDAKRRANLIKILKQFVVDGYQVIYFTAHQIKENNIINLSNPERGEDYE